MIYRIYRIRTFPIHYLSLNAAGPMSRVAGYGPLERLLRVLVSSWLEWRYSCRDDAENVEKEK